MKQLLIGFILGIIVSLMLGSAIYKPYKDVLIIKSNDKFETIMENQEAIFNLIEMKCGK